MALGGVILAVFLLVEARAAEPIVPLGLFRIRAVAVSVGAAFLAASGFFTAVVFLPRWFQVVGGASATISGYEMLPLLAGVIISASAAGPIVAKTGRYRRLLLVAMLAMAAGLALLTQLRVDTPLPVLWAVMFLTGLGVGPVFSVFPMVVQSNVPVTQIGAASSSVSFFQQVGGTVGLAITGTIFATSMTRELPAALGSAGVPADVGGAFASSGGVQALTGVGTSAAQFVGSLPADVRGLVEPFLPAIVGAIHSAFSIATSSTFAIGIATSLLAAALVLLFREAPSEASARSWESAEIEPREPSASAA
jgi:MFS family permease